MGVFVAADEQECGFQKGGKNPSAILMNRHFTARLLKYYNSGTITVQIKARALAYTERNFHSV